jgi:hypothetical protein
VVCFGDELKNIRFTLLYCIWVMHLYVQVYILYWLPSANKLLSSSVFQKIHYFFSLIYILNVKSRLMRSLWPVYVCIFPPFSTCKPVYQFSYHLA